MDEKSDHNKSLSSNEPLLPIYQEKLSQTATVTSAPPPHSTSEPSPESESAEPQVPNPAAMGIQNAGPAPVNNNRTLALVLGAVALLWFTFTATGAFDVYSLGASQEIARPCHGDAVAAAGARRPVPLEAHVMSKCPDTKVRFGP